jgi:diguanylate cyclase
MENPSSFRIGYQQSKSTLLLLTVSICVWLGTIWFLTGKYSEEYISEMLTRERETVRSSVETIGANIVQRLAQIRSVPIVMNGDPSVLTVLRRFGPEVIRSPLPMEKQKDLWLADAELGRMSDRLNEIRSEINLDTLFLLNAAGDCVAAGKLPEIPVFIGTNYSTRNYFSAARNGQNGRQFAVGLVDDTPSIFYSTPVFDEGRFVGAVVARTHLAKLTNLGLNRETFVSDENGVVILAQDREMLWKAMPGAGIFGVSVMERENIYKKKDFGILDLVPVRNGNPSDIVRWGNKPWPYILGTYTSADKLVSVYVLRDLKLTETIRKERLWWFFVVSLAGILALALVLIGVSYVRGNTRYRRDLMRLNENLARQARTDELTGCANRRSFMERLELELQRGKRYVSPFSMLSLDLDHFKRVNDLHGHPAGDQLLRHFVSLVEKNLRSTDLLGRMGGEEFNILLPETGLQEAALIAERIRGEAEASPLIVEQKTVVFTVSIGVAQWQTEADETADGFFLRCDKLLYAAKDAGRNQVKYA